MDRSKLGFGFLLAAVVTTLSLYTGILYFGQLCVR